MGGGCIRKRSVVLGRGLRQGATFSPEQAPLAEGPTRARPLLGDVKGLDLSGGR